MATLMAVLGMMILGGIGGVCAMLFLGYRRPTVHEREVVRAFTAIRSELHAIRRDIGTQ